MSTHRPHCVSGLIASSLDSRKGDLMRFHHPFAIVGALVATAATAQTTTQWTTTWSQAMAQQTLTAADPSSADLTFNNQTVRTIVYTSVGGPQARLHISNLFGTVPLVVGGAHLAVAVAPANPNIVAGTDRIVTFGGSQTVTVKPGAEAVSDAVNFTVLPRSTVAISVFSANSSPVRNTTAHVFSQADHFFANGNQLSTVNMSATGNTGAEIFWLSGLDVPAANTGGSVAVMGASLVDGNFDGNNTERRWPDDLELPLQEAGLDIGIINSGIAGNEALQDNGTFGPSGLSRFSRDVLRRPGVKFVILGDLAINDLSGGATVSQVISATQTFISEAHAAGLTIMCATQTPFKGANGWTQQIEDARNQYNAFIRGNPSPCDAITDQDAVLADPSDPAAILPRLNGGDFEHANATGYQLMAQAVPLTFFTNGAPVQVAPTLVPDGEYIIASNFSGLVVDDGLDMFQGQENDGANQIWQVTNEGNNIVKLTNASNGLVLDVAGGPSLTDGAAVIHAAANGGLSQRWRIEPLSDGFFRIVNVYSDKVIDVNGGSADPGATLDQFPYLFNPWQEWKFTPISSSGRSSAPPGS
jgi:hypothetical protein